MTEILMKCLENLTIIGAIILVSFIIIGMCVFFTLLVTGRIKLVE